MRTSRALAVPISSFIIWVGFTLIVLPVMFAQAAPSLPPPPPLPNANPSGDRVHCRNPAANNCDRMYGSERECEVNCGADVRNGQCVIQSECTQRTTPPPGTNPPLSGSSVELPNPIASPTFADLVKKLAQAITAIGIPLVAIFLVWAGFLFVTSQGSEKKLEQAKQAFYWAVIGGAVVIGAYALAAAIVNFAIKL